MKLSEMPNIGKTLEGMLNNVGIEDSEDLVAVGSIEAVARLQLTDDACLSKLFAIEGAIQGVRWHGLPKELRDSLKDDYYRRVK